MILAQKTDRTRSSYWLVQPGSIHESLVQLSLGDTVEKYHAWLPPVLSLSRSHPARYGSAKKRERPCASLIFLVKSSFGSLKTKEMDQKKGGLLQRAMPPKPTEGSRIRPIASTYNVMITLVYPCFFGSLTDGRPSNKKRYKYGNFSAIWIGEFMEEIGF